MIDQINSSDAAQHIASAVSHSVRRPTLWTPLIYVHGGITEASIKLNMDNRHAMSGPAAA